MDLFPGIARTQRNAVVARAMARFNDQPIQLRDIDFSRMFVGNVHILTFRYKNGFYPSNPQQRDIMVMMGGGYAQQHVLVSVVKITRQISTDVIEVQLEAPEYFSFRNGPTIQSDRYALHRDGHVMFFSGSASEPTEWGNHLPSWEFTEFPVLPVVVSGCDIPATAPIQLAASPPAPVRRADHPPAGERAAKKSRA
jgi:hypothetical protein